MDDRYIRSGTMADYNQEPGRAEYDMRREHGYSSRRSSAREYMAAGELDRGSYGGGYGGGYGRDWERGGRGYDAPRDYAGSYWHDGRRTLDQRGDMGRRDYDRDDGRGFFDRAGDEVRSWFGDEEAERRREMDRRRMREQDDHYNQWRSSRLAEFDRDYDEYRRENAQRFENEFNSWRTERQGQREGLGRVTEHMEVLGSDGVHLGTVDKVRGDRILLSKSDADSGGHHHSIPSRWIKSVDDKVTLSKTADEARNHWREEDRTTAMNWNNEEGTSGRILNRSFSGTY